MPVRSPEPIEKSISGSAVPLSRSRKAQRPVASISAMAPAIAASTPGIASSAMEEANGPDPRTCHPEKRVCRAGAGSPFSHRRSRWRLPEAVPLRVHPSPRSSQDYRCRRRPNRLPAIRGDSEWISRLCGENVSGSRSKGWKPPRMMDDCSRFPVSAIVALRSSEPRSGTCCPGFAALRPSSWKNPR